MFKSWRVIYGFRRRKDVKFSDLIVQGKGFLMMTEVEFEFHYKYNELKRELTFILK